MILKQAIDIYELLDDPKIDGEKVVDFFTKNGVKDINSTRISGDKGYTDFVKIKIPGINGKSQGGYAPTLGVVGRLGGIGARPDVIGMVSDGDGAVAALTAAYKLGIMSDKGDKLNGDVIISTHICPNAPTLEHNPAPFMNSPVNMYTMNENEVESKMDAILSIDTTKGNKIVNHKGVAISPTVKEGYILKLSYDLLEILEKTSGEKGVTFPIAMQDITPYGNGISHINSILQPSTATSSPVVGVAITTESLVAGCDTGASHIEDISLAAGFAIEVAKAFGKNNCSFYDEDEFKKLNEIYGSMTKFQK
ncbi:MULTISPECIES: DUF1177 domain-containing protein [Clostridium]|uniref:DUF1177 domain-containing protein n=2 Tax=Clostridium TaxID=1485 RepID=D8GNI0_CLOLD|nr:MULTISPECIES: DUF1177 domain-containing protein [Clostridium]ADK15843.1 conserved hypothetical protein [Clostridium ljungdahlii DSM 13528]OAA84287.1 hypothetical protein WX45_01144 [Clostridium ljungdahlii DSM 13528]QXE18039.1 hypothetical protein B5S50_03825 [Clostridium sp. 001]RMC99624.1 DUF1177 domain-containing protein [Clostridium autoethanogenum]